MKIRHQAFWIIILITSIQASLVSGQKNFLLSIPEENIYSFNPAYAGLESSLDITAWGREQWSGIPGRPSTQSIVMHAPLYALNGGAGLRIFSDKLGPFRYVKAEVGYDYVVSEDSYLWSIGATAGINQISYDGQALRTTEGIYTGGIIDHNDERLPSGELNGVVPTASIGAYFITASFEGGLALEDIPIGRAEFSTSGQSFDWAPGLAANLFLEYSYDVNEYWFVYADLFVKYDFTDLQMLVKMSALYNNVINAGLGLRGYSGNTLESFILSAGYVIDQHFSVHYAYDIGIGGLAAEASGSHEIILRYNLNKPIGKGRIPKIIGNPRYL